MRGFIISLLLGLIIGTAIGLYIGWVVAPVQYVDSPMNQLATRHKDEYTVMVAAGYATDSDIAAALDRLRPLNEPNIPAYVKDVTERYISQGGVGNENDIRLLVGLSRALGYYTPPMQVFGESTPIAPLSLPLTPSPTLGS